MDSPTLGRMETCDGSLSIYLPRPEAPIIDPQNYNVVPNVLFNSNRYTVCIKEPGYIRTIPMHVIEAFNRWAKDNAIRESCIQFGLLRHGKKGKKLFIFSLSKTDKTAVKISLTTLFKNTGKINWIPQMVERNLAKFFYTEATVKATLEYLNEICKDTILKVSKVFIVILVREFVGADEVLSDLRQLEEDIKHGHEGASSIRESYQDELTKDDWDKSLKRFENLIDGVQYCQNLLKTKEKVDIQVFSLKLYTLCNPPTKP